MFYLLPAITILILLGAGCFWIPINIVELSSGTHWSHLEMVEFFQVLMLSFMRWHQMAVCLRLILPRYWGRTFLRSSPWYSMKVTTLAGGNTDVTFWDCSLILSGGSFSNPGGFFTCTNGIILSWRLEGDPVRCVCLRTGSSPAPFLANSSHLCLPTLPMASAQLREITRLYLSFFPCVWPGNSISAVVWDNWKAYLVCFLSVRHHWCSLADVHWLENNCFYIFYLHIF